MKEILGFVPPDCARNQWIGYLGGIQATNLRDVPDDQMDNELCAITQAWSRGDYSRSTPGNWEDDDDVESAYYSLALEKLGGTTFGTLYMAARDNGYDKPAPGLTLPEKYGKATAAILEGQPPHTPSQSSDAVAVLQGEQIRPKARPKVRLISGADMEPVKVDWLWHGYLALGKFHILGGQKGAGKSTLTFDLFATITTGGRWPDGSRAPLGDVLIWSAEDDYRDTILPRFLAAGGDRFRLHYVDGVDTEDGKSRHFDPATDVEGLLEVARELPNLKAVMVDPVVMAVAGDSHKNAETRRGLQHLVEFATERRVALLGITHFTKNIQGREPIERITGSLAFTALPRIVLGAVKGQTEDAARRLVRIASNIGPAGDGFEYTLAQELLPDYDFTAQRVRWGEELKGSAMELLNDDAQTKGSKLLEAQEFLIRVLTEAGDEGVAKLDVEEAAAKQGITPGTLKRAKKEVGGITSKQREGASRGGWNWILEPAGRGRISF